MIYYLLNDNLENNLEKMRAFTQECECCVLRKCKVQQLPIRQSVSGEIIDESGLLPERSIGNESANNGKEDDMEIQLLCKRF